MFIYQIWIFRAFPRIASRAGFFRAGLKSEKCEPVYSRAGLKSSWEKQRSGSIRLARSPDWILDTALINSKILYEETLFIKRSRSDFLHDLISSLLAEGGVQRNANECK